MKPPGYVLYDGPSRHDGSRILAIVTNTNTATPSRNEKTGDMAQVWVLSANQAPHQAIQTGADRAVCGDCPLRRSICYVQTQRAPLAVYRAWQRGAYPRLSPSEVQIAKPIRFGAYGDPAAVPTDVWRQLSAAGRGRTGYTHGWRTRPSLRGLVMASTETADQTRDAWSRGWRTFRVKAASDPVLEGEIVCPASAEAGRLRGVKTTCQACLLCDGARTHDRRKSIVINKH
jgi:hypothetical protein